jgi:hypothetical protein
VRKGNLRKPVSYLMNAEDTRNTHSVATVDLNLHLNLLLALESLDFPPNLSLGRSGTIGIVVVQADGGEWAAVFLAWGHWPWLRTLKVAVAGAFRRGISPGLTAQFLKDLIPDENAVLIPKALPARLAINVKVQWTLFELVYTAALLL